MTRDFLASLFVFAFVMAALVLGSIEFADALDQTIIEAKR